MSLSLRASGKKSVEIALVLAAYIMFLAIGMYSGLTAMMMDVDIVNPPEDIELHSSPVELAVRVTIQGFQGVPLSDVRARFTIQSQMSEVKSENVTDSAGIAKVVLPAQSGNYTWYVDAIKEGYPTVSRSGNFSIRLSLIVDALLPSTRSLAVSPVDFKARVTDVNGRPVDSADVIFYVDSTRIGSNLTGQNGIARLSSSVASGRHTWFASASKGSEGGISDPTLFIVEQPGSLTTGHFESLVSEVSQLGQRWPPGSAESEPESIITQP